MPMRLPSYSPRLLTLSPTFLLLCLVWGCSATGGPTDGDGSDSGSGASPGDGGGISLGDGGGENGDGDISLNGDGDGDTGSGGIIEGSPVDPCVAAGCGAGQRCEIVSEVASCIDITCEELNCSETEECRAQELGGNVCVNLLCTEDVDCAPEDFCDASGDCVPDLCAAGENSCEADGVHVCASNGSSEEIPYSCGSEAYFDSSCGTETGTAACGCEDDWDCPAFTVCDVDHCVGTGFAPTCTLPPSDFAETEPVAEIHWGTDSPGGAAHDGSGDGTSPPWPASTEVQATPMVANLDDDNGDGLINELDFPEIIFVTYTSGQVDNAGIIRAIHGGGPNRGKDYFAACANGDSIEFNLEVWHEGDPLPTSACNGDGRSRSPATVADLNYDGLPEIIQVTANHGLRILSNTGDGILSMANDQVIRQDGISVSPSVANLDYTGLPEIVMGGTIYRLDTDVDGKLLVAARIDVPSGGMTGVNGTDSNQGGPMTCIADLTSAPGQEILAGSTLYSLSGNTLSTVWKAPGLSAPDGLCAVADVWGAASGTPPGPGNPLDGSPEAVLIANDYLIVLDGATGALIHEEKLNGGEGDQGGTGGPRGGAPNVDDFDGDGFPEVAAAMADFYKVIDFQEPDATNCPEWPTTMPRVFAPGDNSNAARTPGAVTCTTDAECSTGAVCNEQASTCVCLHNGWQRANDDSSSRLTSSSVFDFNGDGAAEVLYNDECDFRIFGGLDGEVRFSTRSRGRTWTENPVVADVDNDGNAEVVTFANTEPGDRCEEDGQTPMGPNGIRVWGDPQDTWVPARRIWNQQSYHVTNITEGGQVPFHAPESWGSFNGLTYNTYRSQPRTFGVAPDLTVSGIGIFSPDAQCGDLSNIINITYEVTNAGDLRVGPGVQLSFYGTWGGVEEPLLGASGGALTAILGDGVDPGRAIIETVIFDLGNQTGKAALPEEIRVVVDTGGDAGSSFGAERECDEANNSRSRVIEGGEQLADLSIDVGVASVDCKTKLATAAVTVINTGVVTASDVVVHLFAGNPAQGGTRIGQTVLADPLAPGASVTINVDAPNFPDNRAVTIWGFVDPGNAIGECNESDNTDPADNEIECKSVVIVIK